MVDDHFNLPQTTPQKHAAHHHPIAWRQATHSLLDSRHHSPQMSKRMGIMRWHQTSIRTHHHPKGVNEMARNAPTEARNFSTMIIALY